MTGRTNALVKLGTVISTLEVGTLVKVNENGAPVEYMIVQQGLPDAMYDASCDGCWLLRKDIAEKRKWDSSNSDYQNSDIYTYLNGDWTSRYDAGILSQIKQVKIPYVNGIGSEGSVVSGANGLSCKIFLLGGYEMGWTTSDNPYFFHDGAKFSYFDSGKGSAANNKRIANYNGSATIWWLRSPTTTSSNTVRCVSSDGDYDGWGCSGTYGVRPALILPSEVRVDNNLNVIPA